MRSILKVAAIFSALVLLAGEAEGQDKKKRPGAGGFRAMGTAAGLVQNASVQKELKLSEEQIEKSKKIATEVVDKFKDDLAKLTKDSKPEERAELNKKVSDEAYKAFGDLLKTEQVKRLKQIEAQVAGLGNASNQKELKLTDKQKDEIKKIVDQTNEKRMEIFKDAKGDFKAAREKMTELTKEAREKQAGVLDDAQKKQWKEITGDPFEIAFERTRRPRAR